MKKLTAHPEALSQHLAMLTDQLEHQRVSTREVHSLIRAGALPEAAEVACRAARGLGALTALRLDVASLAAVAYSERRPGLRA